MKTKMIEREILDRLATGEAAFGGSSRPLLKISNEYPGLWLEHLYDSVAYARLYPEKIYLAENAVNAFIDFATPDGQLPYVIRDAADERSRHGFSQVQECLSFGPIVLLTPRCPSATTPATTPPPAFSISVNRAVMPSTAYQ